MQIKTTRFGDIQTSEDKIIFFTSGLIGFENYKKYILIEQKQNSDKNENEISCFIWLQSIDLENLAFLLIDPFSFYAAYDFELSEKDVKELKIENPADIMVLTTVSLRGSVENMTSNLRAPLVINAKKQLGKQIILPEEKFGVAENIMGKLKSLIPEKNTKEKNNVKIAP